MASYGSAALPDNLNDLIVFFNKGITLSISALILRSYSSALIPLGIPTVDSAKSLLALSLVPRRFISACLSIDSIFSAA